MRKIKWWNLREGGIICYKDDDDKILVGEIESKDDETIFIKRLYFYKRDMWMPSFNPKWHRSYFEHREVYGLSERDLKVFNLLYG